MSRLHRWLPAGEADTPVRRASGSPSAFDWGSLAVRITVFPSRGESAADTRAGSIATSAHRPPTNGARRAWAQLAGSFVTYPGSTSRTTTGGNVTDSTVVSLHSMRADPSFDPERPSGVLFRSCYFSTLRGSFLDGETGVLSRGCCVFRCGFGIFALPLDRFRFGCFWSTLAPST